MRRWIGLLLSVLMLAVAIASTRALLPRVHIPLQSFGVRLFQLQRQFVPNVQDSLTLSGSGFKAREYQTQSFTTGIPRATNTQIRNTSSVASSLNMSSTPSSCDADASLKTSSSATEPALPKLSTQDFQAYNRLATMMDRYHNHFRYTWNILYKTCETGSRPNGMSLRAFISQGLHLCHGLTMHHTIEEQYVFPELAERMPAFKPHDHLISQHEAIHEGLVKLEEYLDACRAGEREMRLPELKVVMDTFGEVLWTHLDDEVRMLGAENMRRYWSKQEILAMNW
jgi:hemerythrin-like domain-containing protein